LTLYIARRLGIAVPTLLVISIILFSLLHLAPGGPMAMYAASPQADPAQLEEIERRLGLRDPLPIQYAKWLFGMMTGDWGLSYKYTRAVTSVVSERIGPSLQLMGASLLIALTLSVPFGVLAAVSRWRPLQYFVSLISMLGLSIPTFWFGMMLLLLLSVRFRVLPSGGMGPIGQEIGPLERLHYLIGPAFVLATLEIATWSRYVRSSILEVMGQDFIRTARAKGLNERVVLYGHALRNALLPLITLVGIQGGRLIGGAVITEVIFAWPGMGRLLGESLAARDYPVVMASFMIMSVLVIAGNLLADICYGIADPRIRLS
jgi:peptide/nickel transport system permease protein